MFTSETRILRGQTMNVYTHPERISEREYGAAYSPDSPGALKA